MGIICDFNKRLHYATKIYTTTPCTTVPPLIQNTYQLATALQNNSERLTEDIIMGAEEVNLAAEMGLDELYPAVIECFSVILLGYIAGKCGIISTTETKGLNTFIGTFSLPALIFLSMAQLDLSFVNWYFLLSITLAKAIVFFLVLIVSLLVSRPLRLEKAGIFAIFASQSNDFALGYPIIAALYGKTHPEYASYLYLFGPINLIILNPIAFALMEISKQKDLMENSQIQDSSSASSGIHGQRSKNLNLLTVAKRVVRGILLNPIVLMTILGICGNLIFIHCLPQTIVGILNMLGSAFSASALFSLGLTMVGSAASLRGSGLVVPGILIIMKLLALPVVARECVNFFNAGTTVNETLSLSNFAFLYGTFPTAPGVFVYAVQYSASVEMIAGAMVACTFISAPLMFISAKMITLRQIDPKDYIPDFDNFLLDISIIGVITTVWVIIVFILSRKWRKVPHCITLCLVISQTIGCVGAILWSVLETESGQHEHWKLYVKFSIFSFGVLSARIWTAILATSLVFLKCRSLCFVLRLRPYMAFIGWGIPAALTTMLLLTVRKEHMHEKRDPNFQYGETQAVVAAMVLIISFIVTIGCLVMQQRYERRHGNSHYGHLESEPSAVNHTNSRTIIPVPISAGSSQTQLTDVESLQIRPSNQNTPASSLLSVAPPPVPQRNRCSSNCGTCPQAGTCSSSTNKKPDKSLLPASTLGNSTRICISEIEDLIPTGAGDFDDDDSDDDPILFSYNDNICSPTKFSCDSVQRKQCGRLLERYRAMNQLTEPAEIGIVRDRDDEFQMLRHIVLLVLLSVSMFVGIALCVWTLIMEEVSGIYVELVFLDATLNFGQGFLSFMLFGLNTRMIVMPLHKWWRRLVYGEGSLVLPKWEDLPHETKQICEQFLTYHFDKCVKDIVRNRTWRMESYSQVFCGHELVDWLMLVGLARDRNDGVKYGKHLLAGRVIRHIKQLHHFHDQAFFYTFSLSLNSSSLND